MDRPSDWPEMTPEQYRRYLDQVTNRSIEDLHNEFLHYSLEERLERNRRAAWAFMENEKKGAHERAVQAELLKAYIYRRFYRMIVYVVLIVVSLAVLLFLLRDDSLGLLAALAIWAVVGLLMYYQWVKK